MHAEHAWSGNLPKFQSKKRPEIFYIGHCNEKLTLILCLCAPTAAMMDGSGAKDHGR